MKKLQPIVTAALAALMVAAACTLPTCSNDFDAGPAGRKSAATGAHSEIDFSARPDNDPPNIILISIDTLRADFVSPRHMPKLTDFANKSCMVFTNAHSHSTWTKPSHLTMLTGMLQSRHGMEYVDGPVPEDIVMAQESLKAAGYATVAFTGGGFLDKSWGFNRGFDSYDQTPFSVDSETADIAAHLDHIRTPLDRATEYLRRSDDMPSPLFLFIHTYEVHEWWLRHFPPDTPRRGKEDARKLWKLFEEETSLEEARRLYGIAAREADERIEGLLRAALSSPLKENLCIIITSDHGEGLGEQHGDFVSLKHNVEPYAEQIRVPLLIFGMGKGATDRLAGVDEIAPFILWLAGIGDAAFGGDRSVLISEYVSEKREDTDRALALLTADGKYLLSRDGVLHLYKDPQDATDLFHTRHLETDAQKMPEALKNELEALGYLN